MIERFQQRTFFGTKKEMEIDVISLNKKKLKVLEITHVKRETFSKHQQKTKSNIQICILQ